jgi:DNA replication protein DnaC
MSSECDCVGPSARTETGECRVLAEAAVLRELQRRRMEGAHPTTDEIEALCRGRGLVAHSEQLRRRNEEMRSGADPRDMGYRLQRLGVPARALLALRGVQETPAIAEARKYLQAPAEWCQFLALFGPTGLGKTVAAAYVFREAARAISPDLPTGTPEPLVWVQGPDFTRVSAFSPEDERKLKAMRSAQLLVVDELGDEATNIGVAAVRDVLMHRESQGRRSVLTSNLRPEVFRERYGAALWDRLDKRGLIPNLAKAQSMRTRTQSAATKPQEAKP